MHLSPLPIVSGPAHTLTPTRPLPSYRRGQGQPWRHLHGRCHTSSIRAPPSPTRCPHFSPAANPRRPLTLPLLPRAALPRRLRSHPIRCRARAGVNLAATVLPSPSRAVQQLRLDALVLSAESGNAERPASPPAPSTSPPLLRDCRRPPDVVSPSPTAPFAST